MNTKKDWLDQVFDWCPPVLLVLIGVPVFLLMMIASAFLPPKWTGINNWRRPR